MTTNEPIVSRLAEVQGRLDAATPGNWFRAAETVLRTGDTASEWVAEADRVEDAEFIAHAPADLVWALSVIRQQQETIEKLAKLTRGLITAHAEVVMDAPEDIKFQEEFIAVSERLLTALTAPTTEKENDQP